MIAFENDRLLRTIRRQAVDATPIWIMRQAGRYLPEYRRLREKAGSFMKLCKTPELAAAVTLQPLQRYDLDAAIIFSDILTIPDAMGLDLQFVEGEGPIFARCIRQHKDLSALTVPKPAQLHYVYDAIHLACQSLNKRVPLIGFCGSPWTLAVYMVEGKSKTAMTVVKQLVAHDPALIHALLDLLTQAVVQHLSAQIQAGVAIVMLFDTWGGILNDVTYQTFSLSYSAKIIAQLKQLHPAIPIILFTKGGGCWLESIAATQCDVVGLDWEISLKEARKRIGKKVILQGNLHPETLLKPKLVIQQAVKHLLAEYGAGTGHIFNLGHGIMPNVPPENVQVLIDAVHESSKPYHVY